MNNRTKQRAGTLVAAVLAADGILHTYWATGRHWPAQDARSLAHAVLNSERPFNPAAVAPLAGLLLLGALTAQARVGRLGWPGQIVPYAALQASVLVIATGLLVRGAAGIGMALAGEAGTPFDRLNRAVYTPACFALGVAALVAARSEHA